MQKIISNFVLMLSIAFAACNNNSTMNNESKSESTKTDTTSNTQLIPSVKNFQSTIDGKPT
ncbi:MAG TPA: hypothetical protein VGI61_10075, partial [Parafilimonas sp.]